MKSTCGRSPLFCQGPSLGVLHWCSFFSPPSYFSILGANHWPTVHLMGISPCVKSTFTGACGLTFSFFQHLFWSLSAVSMCLHLECLSLCKTRAWNKTNTCMLASIEVILLPKAWSCQWSQIETVNMKFEDKEKSKFNLLEDECYKKSSMGSFLGLI